MERTKAKQILEILQGRYPDAKPALLFGTPFELLVAVILSAQCTDKRVNEVTKKLFARANTPAQFAQMPLGELETAIYPCGFYHDKAKHIIDASKAIMEKFDGKVPETLDELQTLPGVGRKTANVVYAVAFHGDAIAVDTHVFRVSNRLGLAAAKDVTNTEKQLNAMIDKEMWSRAHHLLIYHGRNICKSRNPDCPNCPVAELCEYPDKRGETVKGE